MIKEYFANYFLHMSNVTFDMQSNQMEVHEKYAEPWRVTIVDTGEATLTGGRLGCEAILEKRLSVLPTGMA
jgi:glucose-1-phosphate cytidylyltransferase